MSGKWSKLNVDLSHEIQEILAEKGFDAPTPVQESAIPWLLKYKDVVAEAVTGSGKTLAFVIPLFELMKRRPEPWKPSQVAAVIVSPTADLAEQIYQVVLTFLPAFHKTLQSQSDANPLEIGRTHLWSASLFVGGGLGSKLADDVRKFDTSVSKEGCNIVIATPGRLCDLLKNSIIQRSMKSLELLVLDEADRLLDMGFKTQLDLILRTLPKQRRTGLFSATQTENVEDFIRAGLRNPVVVNVREKANIHQLEHDSRTPGSLQKYFMIVPSELKFSFLVDFLREFRDKKILIFFSTVECVRYFGGLLQRILRNREVLSIHRKVRKKRLSVYEKYGKSSNAILVASDLASRGIDFNLIDWVVLFEPPKTAAEYVHRCGRTGRTGNAGRALLLLRPSEAAYIPYLEKNQQVRLKELPAPEKLVDNSEIFRRKLLKDRFLAELSFRAFVSFVQFYLKQECSRGVLNFNDLDLVALAKCFALLKLPHMPELKGKDLSQFSPVNVEIHTLPFFNKSIAVKRKKLEAKKQAEVAEGGQEAHKGKTKKVVAWSKIKEKREKKKKRKLKKSSSNAAVSKAE